MSNIIDERVEIISQYAATADDLLAQEYGEDYEKEDVVKLATYMLNHDIEAEEAEEVEETTKEASYDMEIERREAISEYVKTASALLTEEHGEDFTNDDVVKLAQYMIEYDVEVEEEEAAKVASYEEAGQIMANAFLAELSKEAEEV